MEVCDKCGQEFDIADQFTHEWVRHSHIYTEQDFKIARNYFEKYPHHKYHREEWLEFISRVKPDMFDRVFGMDDNDFRVWCAEYATYYSNKLKNEAREQADKKLAELQDKHKKDRSAKRWWKFF